MVTVIYTPQTGSAVPWRPKFDAVRCDQCRVVHLHQQRTRAQQRGFGFVVSPANRASVQSVSYVWAACRRKPNGGANMTDQAQGAGGLLAPGTFPTPCNRVLEAVQIALTVRQGASGFWSP